MSGGRAFAAAAIARTAGHACCASQWILRSSTVAACTQVTPAVRALWARLLLAVPTARLVVKAKPFACDAVRARFAGAFAALGVHPARLDLLPLAAATAAHLAAYSQARPAPGAAAASAPHCDRCCDLWSPVMKTCGDLCELWLFIRNSLRVK
jgi:hypothetical protein